MMISTQMSCVCSPCIPQLGLGTCIQSPVSLTPLRRQQGDPQWSRGFQKGHGPSCTSSAMKQASPFSSTAEDASHDDGVPANNTTLHDITGAKTKELMDPIALAKVVDNQLPPLLSMAIDGLPPFQISKYLDEAEKYLHEYVKRYPNAIFLDSYCRAGLSAAVYGHPGAVSVERIIAISINYALQFLVDDIFFDNPKDIYQDHYGISHDAHGSPQKIQEYFDRIDAIFGLQVQPSKDAPLMETIMWDAGQYTLGVTNLDWFNHYVTCLEEHHHAGVVSHEDIIQGHNLHFQDVESYANMRAGNVGGRFVQMMVELANDSYIPYTLRTDPYVANLTSTTSIHLGFVNDVFSYPKESLVEHNPRNLISVLLECEGKPFVQTAHIAIGVANSYGRAILDLESQAWNPTLRNHMEGIKALMAGNVYFSYMDTRYRHPDSIFVELRDTNSNWKILPDTKSLGL